MFIKLVSVGLIIFDIFLHLPYLFSSFIKNIEWEKSLNYICQMSLCRNMCNVIVILRNLFCFIFQSLLMAIGTAFLYNVDEFKIYSTYCANHSKAQKALHQSELLTSPYHLWIIMEEFFEEFPDFHWFIAVRGHQKNETTNSPILQFTNLKCCKMSFKAFIKNEKARLKMFFLEYMINKK